MLQVTPHTRILVAIEPADFRRGIDGLARQCKELLQEDPFSGTMFVFRNRRGTAVKLLMYDGQGFWLCQKRLLALEGLGRGVQGVLLIAETDGRQGYGYIGEAFLRLLGVAADADVLRMMRKASNRVPFGPRTVSAAQVPDPKVLQNRWAYNYEPDTQRLGFNEGTGKAGNGRTQEGLGTARTSSSAQDLGQRRCS